MKDIAGIELEVGDIVYVPCVVTRISHEDNWNNVHLETIEKNFPGEGKTGVYVNARQVEFVSRNALAKAAAPPDEAPYSEAEPVVEEPSRVPWLSEKDQ